MPSTSSAPSASASQDSIASRFRLRAKDFGTLDSAAQFVAWKFNTELTIQSTDGFRTILDANDRISIDSERQLALLALLSQLVKDKSGASVIRRAARSETLKGYTAWSKLMEHYLAKSQWREEALQRQLREAQQPDEDFKTYATRLQDAKLDLEDMDVMVDDKTLVSFLLAGLRPEYDPIVLTVRTSPPKKVDTFDKVFNLFNGVVPYLEDKLKKASRRSAAYVSDEGAQREKSHNPRVAAGSSNRSNSNRSVSGNNSGNSGGKADKKNIQCFKCKKFGHYANRCRSKKAPAADEKNGTKEEANLSEELREFAFSATESFPEPQSLLTAPDSTSSEVPETPPVYPNTHDDIVPEGSEMATPFEEAVYTDYALLASAKSTWILDTGATSHITSSRSDFTIIKKIEPIWIEGINTKAIGKGVVKQACEDEEGRIVTVVLHNVLLCPDLGHREGVPRRLLSFSKLEDQGISVNLGQGQRLLTMVDSTRIPVTRQFNLYFVEMMSVEEGYSAVNVNPPSTRRLKLLWHQRLAHLNSQRLDEIADHIGIHLEKKPMDFCPDCVYAKSHVQPKSKELHPKPDEIMHMVGVDLFEMRTTSLQGHKYVFGAADYTGPFVWLEFLEKKSEAPIALRRLIEFAIQKGHPIKVIRMDNDPVFLSNEFTQILNEAHIEIQLSAPYCHWQNGLIERSWRTISEAAQAMLSQANLGKEYWEFAFKYAVYIQNRLPHKGRSISPYEMLTGTRAKLREAKVFGCDAYLYVQPRHRNKFDPKAKKGIFVGISNDSRTYLVLQPETGIVTSSRDVVFDEKVLDLAKMLSMREERRIRLEELEKTKKSGDPDLEGATERSTIEKVELPHAIYTATAPVTTHPDPESYGQAITGPNAEEWREAVLEEYSQLCAREIFEVQALPKGKKAIPVKWIFKTKYDKDGTVSRFKARLVVKGFHQREGVDFNEIFAPTLKFSTLRLMLSISLSHGLHFIEQIDVDTAFLNATLREEIYVEQPEGFKIVSKTGERLVWRLFRALYGLKQAPFEWYECFKSAMLKLGFKPLVSDPSAYFYRDKKAFCLLAVYVDDIVISTNNKEFLLNFKSQLSKEFKIKELGPCSWLLGMAVSINPEVGIISLNQEKYINDMLSKFNMEDANISLVPATPDQGRNLSTSSPLDDKTPYQALIGSLLWASTATRPDISEAVGRLCRAMASPTMEHWTQAKKVLRYLKKTKTYSLTLGRNKNAELTGYVDANFAPNHSGRRSTTGYIFFYNGGAISWKSTVQPTVALSSSEAEYMALASATQEAIYLRQILKELGILQPTPTVMHEDNQSCKNLAEGSGINARTKHIDVRYHFIRDAIKDKVISVVYCPTAEMIADFLTKPLTEKNFTKFRDQVLEEPEN